jgi:glyoxylase-like metal-dependent hydrolase (beta-lactamase superfamily II)/8-oxo-dGTP pyrophosphatase MutT (NUDIX family)
MRFMGGWQAFPGGGLARGDDAIALAGEPQGSADGPADGGMPEAITEGLAELAPNVAAGIAACALRELFEETGILPLAPHAGSGSPRSSALAEERRRLLEGEAAFADIARGLAGAPDASRLAYAGRWLTPPFGPLRFDTRFFLLAWPREEHCQPEVVPGEAEHGEWIEAGDAITRWRKMEVIAAPPILHILRVLAEDGPEAGLARLRDPAEATLGVFRRVEFRPGVLLVPLATPTLPPATHTNAIVLGCGQAILVDPGSPSPREIGRLLDAVAALPGRLGRQVTAIWLTHHHPDHVGGVPAVRRALGVPVCAHRATAERLAERGITVDRELADGERVVLAGDPPMAVRVLHTPGHARGHLCFLEEDGGSLVAGDMISGLSTIVIDPPEGDMDDYLASLERLRGLAPRTLFPAHGPVLVDGAARFAELIGHRLEREERVLAAWNEGLREPAAIVPRAYDEVPAGAAPLAARQVAAHLERLRRAGRIRPSS